ncbi:MAG: prolipoprotein diacylglyceryl transferase [Planctomycetota bacterium]|jgi:phosphatidylglycerol:prolipoprotein diacylglycerol transferase
MYRVLFKIPFTPLTVWSYGLMMVVAFLSAVFIIRRLSRDITPDPQLITNAALYSLIAGVVGARLFHVVHYFDTYRGDFLSVFAIWQGGLELLGGVIFAVSVIFLYLRYHKLPKRRYLDILAIGLMSALAFGRIGCFLNGCCFGKPTNLPWAVRFPYDSPPYRSQVSADPQRNRSEPHLHLPDDFFGYVDEKGQWYLGLKPYKDLIPEQKDMVDKGPYRCLPVHPTQLYSSISGAAMCLILYLFWRRSRKADAPRKPRPRFAKPGCTFGLMFVLYGIFRFLVEFLRDDNPFEYSWWAMYKGRTVSQNLGIYMVIFGLVLMVIFQQLKPGKIPRPKSK